MCFIRQSASSHHVIISCEVKHGYNHIFGCQLHIDVPFKCISVYHHERCLYIPFFSLFNKNECNILDIRYKQPSHRNIPPDVYSVCSLLFQCCSTLMLTAERMTRNVCQCFMSCWLNAADKSFSFIVSQ